MLRIYFDSEDYRNRFFDSVKAQGSFKTWQELANFLGKKRTVLDYYRSGQVTLPRNLFERMCSFISHKSQLFFQSKSILLESNWGRSKGGITTYSKHPEIFERGRTIGIQKFAIMRELCGKNPSFDLDIALSPALCEFMGAFMGDGFTNVYNGRHYQIGFAGHSRLDRDYYDFVIMPIAKKLFGLEGHVRTKGNGMWVNFGSKRLFQLLTQRFGMPAGIKFDTVLIPPEILSADKKLLSCCLRGIFDTDGCVFFDKRKIYREPYIRAELHMCNERIIEQIAGCLHGFGIPAKMLRNKQRIQIIGKKAVQNYLEKIGFSNAKHRARIAEFAPELEKITNKLEPVS